MKDEKADIDVSKGEAKSPVSGTGSARGRTPFATLRDEIDRLFEEFDSGMFRLPAYRGMRRETAAAPSTDFVEAEDAYRVTAEIPGLEPEDVDVRLGDNLLTIRGEKSEETVKDEEQYHLRERRFGAFRRDFSLPRGVDLDNVTASVSNGILTVELPKTAEAKQKERKVEVTQG